MARIAILFILSLALQAQSFKPFEMIWRADSGVEADVSFLLDAPAGKNGFITIKGGHLVKPDGQRFRLWGVNLPMQGNRPEKKDAAAYAAHLARFGVNCVRIHHLDWRAPRGIIDSRQPNSRTFDAEQLDRLDFFIAELKKRGIYVDLNLNVGRTFEKEDGVKEYEKLGFAKAVTLFDERMIELEKEYARMLLTHRNPYTKTEYRYEPAVAIVELVNENSLLDYWTAGRLSGKGLTPGQKPAWAHIPASYERDLTAKFNAWLPSRLSRTEFAAMRKEAGVADEAPIPRLKQQEIRTASALRFQSEAAFYEHLETRFFLGMQAFLKDDLGVKALLIASSAHNAGSSPYGVVSSTSKLDIVDAHVYWQAPTVVAQPGGKRRIDLVNIAMVNDPEHSTVVVLSRVAVAGKPFIVSEMNHQFPNEYACEGMPIVAAYAAFHDWDGVFWYSFSHTEPSSWKPSPPGPLDIRQEPVKLTEFAAGALIFARGDVAPAKQTVLRSYSKPDVYESIRMPRSEAPYYTPGFPRLLPLFHGTRISSLDAKTTVDYAGIPEGPAVSDTGQLAWAKGLVTVDTDRSQALIGYVRSNSPKSSNLAVEVDNEFCAIVISSLDGKPIPNAQKLLLTTSARVANEGMQWNEKHTSILEVGTGPVTIEPVTGAITLRNLQGASGLEVVPLDGAGRPGGAAIPGIKKGADWQIPIGSTATPWYLVRVKR